MHQDGRISFEFGAVQAQMNGMRLRSGRVKPRHRGDNGQSSHGHNGQSSVSRRGVKRKQTGVPDPVAELPYRISHILDQDHVPREIQVENSWSDNDKSANIYLHVSFARFKALFFIAKIKRRMKSHCTGGR